MTVQLTIDRDQFALWLEDNADELFLLPHEDLICRCPISRYLNYIYPDFGVWGTGMWSADSRNPHNREFNEVATVLLPPWAQDFIVDLKRGDGLRGRAVLDLLNSIHREEIA